MDGEGSFVISIHKQPHMTMKHQITPHIEMSLTKSSGWILEKIQKTLGVGTIKCRERKNNEYPNRNPLVVWRIRNMEQVNELTDLLTPYLQLKKQIAQNFKIILSMWNKGEQNTSEGFIKMSTLRDQLNNHRTKGPSYLNSDYFRRYFTEHPITDAMYAQAEHYRRRPKYLKKFIEKPP